MLELISFWSRKSPNWCLKEVRKVNREITIRNGETEITINEQAISVSAPNISLTVMSDEESTSVTTVTKNGIVSQIQ